MNPRNPVARRSLRSLATLGATVSAVMFGVTAIGALDASALPAGTAPTAGQSLSVTSGNATSDWKLNLASTNNTCPGDGLAGFRWSTFMVPASVDAATLTYNSGGPIAPSGVTFTYPLYSSTGSPQVAKTPSIGAGLITGTPANFNFSALASLPVPNGEYKIGYACHKDGQTERYWQTSVTVTNSTASGFDFAVPAAPSPTTTVAPTTAAPTTVAPTTTAAGATTTTRPATTTTTTAGSTTTSTTVAAGGPTTTVGTGTGTTIPFTTLPSTGPDRTGSLVVWGVLLLVFGRMVVLFARPVRVAPPKSR